MNQKDDDEEADGDSACIAVVFVLERKRVDHVRNGIGTSSRPAAGHFIDQVKHLEGRNDAERDDHIGNWFQNGQRNVPETFDRRGAVHYGCLADIGGDVHNPCIIDDHVIACVFPDRHRGDAGQGIRFLAKKVDGTETKEVQKLVDDAALRLVHNVPDSSGGYQGNNDRNEDRASQKRAKGILKALCDEYSNQQGENGLDRHGDKHIPNGIGQGLGKHFVIEKADIVIQPDPVRGRGHVVFGKREEKRHENRRHIENSHQNKAGGDVGCADQGLLAVTPGHLGFLSDAG